ncbi:hypothetical protein HYFRA_00005156 [Hymenoscyphus fraxineus]|uniref:Uncharacterized protein n=1 Tax=Hymenoscyphus fraxineus TaxID=746836 RepID=A0A9N9LCT3_9HELO|nr:hypothetical protein HYFRA_00005156 [Hymenoscyphus fraxineus]
MRSSLSLFLHAIISLLIFTPIISAGGNDPRADCYNECIAQCADVLVGEEERGGWEMEIMCWILVHMKGPVVGTYLVYSKN